MKFTKEEFATMIKETVAAGVKAEIEARGLDNIDRKFVSSRTGVSEETIASMDAKQKALLFFKSVMSNDVTALANLKAMNEGTGSAGGFLVPEEFEAMVMRIVEDFGIVRSLSTVIPMTSDTKRVPVLSSSVTVSFPGEATAASESQPVFAEAVLNAKTAVGITPMSNEFLADADVNVVDLLAQLFAERIAYAEDTQGLVGTGSPFTGVLNDTGVTVVTPSIGNSTFTLCSSPDNLRDLITQLKPWALNGAAYFMHPAVWAIVQKQKNATSGDYWITVANPVIGPNSAANPLGLRSVGTIWGYPVYLSEAMPSSTAVSTKYIIFGNLKHALLGDRAGITVDITKDATVGSANLFERNMSAIRVTRRFAFTVGLGSAFAVLRTSAS